MERCPRTPWLAFRALLVLVVAGYAHSAAATDAKAEQQLLRGIAAYARRDWDAALKFLGVARKQAESPAMQAKVSRQFGLVYVEVDRPEEALEAFRVALRKDATLEIDLTRVGPAAGSLFQCARRLPPSLPRVAKLVADGHGGYACPRPFEASPTPGPIPIPTPIAATKTPTTSERGLTATPSPAPIPGPRLETRGPDAEPSSGGYTTWLLAGTTAAAASVGTVFLFQSIADASERDAAASRSEFDAADSAARGSIVASNVAFAVAGVAAAALATYLIVGWVSDSTE
jgi:hypothetical protein